MEAFDRRLGVIYADASDSDSRFDNGHLELLTRVAAIAALAFEHASYVEQLDAQNFRLQQDLNVRHELVGTVRPWPSSPS